MKKYISLLFLVTLLLSCNNEESLFQEPTRVLADGELVTIGMSIKLDEIPIASRTMAQEKPATDVNAPLWVAVFDGTGQFVEAAKAFNPIKRDDTNIIDFSLRLHTTSEERRLHFILNYADEMTFEYGNESIVIGSLTTMKNSASSNEDVYWQRRVLPEGIQILVNEKLQPVDPDGNLVDQNNNGIDGNEKVFTNTGELLEAIPMVRNYAKITVVDNADNFELTGYYVMNVPTSGSVAPYMGEGEFATFGSPTEGIPSQSYNDLLADGYIGFMPDNVGYSNQVASALDNGSATWISPTTGEGENSIVNPFYMYESTNDGDKSHTVSILLRGIYNGGDVTYYKADLVYPNAEQGNLPMYYHVLRNFHYELTINSVSGDGKKTAAEAAAIAAGNNFSGSVDVKNLLNISDGEAALYVWYTDTLFVDSKQFELKYKFINDISSPKNSSNEDVNWFLSGEDGKHIIEEPERALDENGNYYKDEDGWGILKLTPTGTEGVFSETLTLYNSTTQLSREVVLAYRTRYTMDVVVCPENVDAAAGKDVIVNIQIPTGLSETMFPLEFVLEAQSLNSTEVLQNCLSPNTTESISVKLGTSIVPGFEGQQSYQFIVTLDYDAYVKLSTTESGNQKVLPVKFKTNIAANASIVYVNNIYFNQGTDFFRNSDSKAILYAKWENSHLYGAGQKATLSFIASETGDYTIAITEDEAAEGRATSNKTVNLQAGEQYREEITTSTDTGSLSATIEKSTTSVTVVGENRVFPISNAKLSASSSYYGEGQTVLLTFNI